MKTPLTTAGAVYTSTSAGNTTEQTILFGLTLTLPGALNFKEATAHIQEMYFDVLGHSGFFRLMGQTHRERASKDYLTDQNIPEQVFLDAVRPTSDGNTNVDVLFAQVSFEDTPEVELSCTTAELDEAVEHNIFVSYAQFSLKPV